MIIAIDGTTASGKGTLAKRIADRYGLKRLDTGALYRAVALALIDSGEDAADAAAAERAARALDLDAIDDARIRSGEVGAKASVVAAIPSVRAALLDAQRAFAAAPQGAVLDGRDIGTVVCPDAHVKFFVDAALDVRVKRRLAELVARGEAIGFERLREDVAARDERDRNRPIAPLRPAEGAVVIDTTELGVEEAAAAAFAAIEAIVIER